MQAATKVADLPQPDDDEAKTAPIDDAGHKALERIHYEEGNHFVKSRMLFVVTNLILLMTNSFFNKKFTNVSALGKNTVQLLFSACMMGLTYF